MTFLTLKSHIWARGPERVNYVYMGAVWIAQICWIRQFSQPVREAWARLRANRNSAIR